MDLIQAGRRVPLHGSSVSVEAGKTETEVTFILPAELRNRVTRFEVEGARSAGAVSLTDDSLRRREVGIDRPRNEQREGLQLLSPTHYLEQALVESADLIDGAIARTSFWPTPMSSFWPMWSPWRATIKAIWKTGCGTVVCCCAFAGPRLAASDLGRNEEDTLMPVRLRAGGRPLAARCPGANRRRCGRFSPESPFFGLPIPEDVTVSSQVMAQPDPTLAGRTIATLADGTPLVTRQAAGSGASGPVPCDGQRGLVDVAAVGSVRANAGAAGRFDPVSALEAGDLEGTLWALDQMCWTGFGRDRGRRHAARHRGASSGGRSQLGTGPAAGALRGREAADRAERIGARRPSWCAPVWPADVAVEGFAVERETPLMGALSCRWL